MSRPPVAPVALTCGEVAGIGPELAPRVREALRGEIPLLWLGNPAHLPEGTRWHAVGAPREALADADGSLAVLPLDIPGPRTPAHPRPEQAQGTIDAIARAVALVRNGACCALTTAPIHKQALQDGAGFAYPGHTEFLAALAGAEDAVMMLAGPELRVVPVTIHVALSRVPAMLTPSLLESRIRITHDALIRQFGIARPRIAVAGLNPHAGEGGKMGREEIEVIAPVLERLRAEGMDLRGPLSADTMFHARARRGHDAAVCMYHDQALIPIKTLDFDRGVNVTLGLPFVRTSPDHGTAFDIAGSGRADPTSTIEAVRLAWRLAARR